MTNITNHQKPSYNDGFFDVPGRNTLMGFFLASALFICCNPNSTGSKVNQYKDLRFGDIKNVEPQLLKTDSIQILYYSDPMGDSLRYSRFYTFTSLSDTNSIRKMLLNLSKEFVPFSQKRNCRSQGKIYCYAGCEVVKTIYFNMGISNCNYLYYIKNGAFNYFDLEEEMSLMLLNSKLNAVAPPAADTL